MEKGNKSSEKYNEIAAQWWADKLRISRPVIDDERVDAFEKRLSEIIEDTVEKRGNMYLSVDLYADYTLGSIAKEFGISTGAFPCKTSMNVTKDIVVCKVGTTRRETLFSIYEG